MFALGVKNMYSSLGIIWWWCCQAGFPKIDLEFYLQDTHWAFENSPRKKLKEAGLGRDRT